MGANNRLAGWSNTEDGDTLAACGAPLLSGGRVRSLAEVAQILNASGKYQRKLSPSDVLTIERQAIQKLRIRLGGLN